MDHDLGPEGLDQRHGRPQPGVRGGVADQPGVLHVLAADADRDLPGHVAGQGRPLEEGEPANITLWDPAATTVVDPARHASKGRNSPYRGMELPGAVRATFFRGHPTVLDGALHTPVPTSAA